MLDYEIIYVDDGSTDLTGKMVNGLNDSRIRVVSDGKRLGAGKRRNQARSESL